jgi:glyoxylase-like metal-dependent hydrolase (beta-lactamase superfamily II)
MREEQVRTQGDNPTEVGGGQRPIIGERKSISFYRDGYAWNENPDGSIVARTQDVTIRRLEIVMTPHGFIREALKAKDLKLEERAESFRSTKRIRTVSFRYMDRYPLTGWIDEANHVTKIQTWHPNPVVGDQFVETRYAQYRQFDGFSFGTEVHQSIGTPPHPSYDFTAANLAVNVPNAALEIPAAVRQATDNSAQVTTRELSPGVWLIGGNNYNSVAIEFAEFSLVVEAPVNEQRSQAVMREVRRLVPTKPLRYVVNTHHHFDHAGGLRTYLSQGTTIVTHETNKQYYLDILFDPRPRTLQPDRMALFNPMYWISRRPPPIETVAGEPRSTAKYVVTDGERILEVIKVQDVAYELGDRSYTQGNHSVDMLIAYLPKEKILFNADLYSPPAQGTAAAPPSPSMRTLLQNIRKLKLDVSQHAPAHGRVGTHEEFMRLVGSAGTSTARAN